MMSIKYEHLLCVSDALGALHVPLLLLLSFGPFSPSLILRSLV